MAHKVGRRLRRKGIEGTTLHLKIRREDLSVRTCQRHKADLGTNDLSWLPELYSMLNEVWDGWEPLRLVGVGVSGFNHDPVQGTLFDIAPSSETDENSIKSPLIRRAEANKKLLEANDLIAQRFGENAVRFGHELRTYQETTEVAPKTQKTIKTSYLRILKQEARNCRQARVPVPKTGLCHWPPQCPTQPFLRTPETHMRQIGQPKLIAKQYRPEGTTVN